LEYFKIFLVYASYVIFGYFLFVQSFYILLMFTAFPCLTRRMREVNSDNLLSVLRSESSPEFSFIVAAYNMEQLIVLVIDNLLALHYKKKKIVIVNDGSEDNTFEILLKRYKLVKTGLPRRPQLKCSKIRGYYRSSIYPNLIVVDKENGGKADAMNAGLNVTTTPYYLQIDADTVVGDDAILRIIRSSLTKPHVIACGGSIGIGNQCIFERHKLKKVMFPTNFWAGAQVVEYIRAFLFGRLGWNSYGGNLCLSGAFGFYDRDIAVSVGGYDLAVAEDLDMTIRIHRALREKGKPYKITFLPDAMAFTEVPSDLVSLLRQRERWQRGVNIVVWRNRNILFNSKYGFLGLMSFPILALTEAISPLIEAPGYIIFAIAAGLGIVDWTYVFWYLALALLFPMVLSSICIMMEILSVQVYNPKTAYLKMLGYVVIESLGVRQMLVFVRFYSFFLFIFGIESWTNVKRKGIQSE